MNPSDFTRVSQWIEAGHIDSGFDILGDVAGETPKAIGFHAEKWNRAANLFKTIAWFPKSQITRLENDYYTDPSHPKVYFMIPNWLLKAKRDEGYELYWKEL